VYPNLENRRRPKADRVCPNVENRRRPKADRVCPNVISRRRPKADRVCPNVISRRRPTAGGCHVLAKQAVLAEPPERRQCGAKRRSRHEHQRERPQPRPLGNATAASRRTVVGSRGSASTASSLRSETRGTRRCAAATSDGVTRTVAGRRPAGCVRTSKIAAGQRPTGCVRTSQDAAAPWERRVPRACEASSAS
jgi:hypothetical protein